MDTRGYLKYALELEKAIYTLDKSIGYLRYRENQLSGVARQYQKLVKPEKYPLDLKIIDIIGAALYKGRLLAICLGFPIGVVNSQITARNSEILSFIATYNAIRY